jgi:hypothetical protein
MKPNSALLWITAALLTLAVAKVLAWNNGPSGNTTTTTPEECNIPPYATHDWIADHAVALLPENEREWIAPHMSLYLIGTEAPDSDNIPDACGGPNTGYDDRQKGHSVEWAEDWSKMVKDRAARRAQEEYDKGAKAFKEGSPSAAAYYLGAMAHYIGDVSQYGHSVPFEQHHGDYETWVASRTDSFNAGHFESYIKADGLVKRSAYTAAKRISRATAKGQGTILSAAEMDNRYTTKGQQYIDSIGQSLNLGVNELADVLHTFHLNVVSEQ